MLRANPIAELAPYVRYTVLLTFVATICSGCVRRRLEVRTNPPGAQIYIDKQLIGESPISTSVTFYGTREIEAVADGYRTEKVLRKFSPPWYQYPGFDFVSETLWPGELRDERIVDITLVPHQQIANDVLLARADELRLQAQQGLATPLPPPAQPQQFNPNGPQPDTIPVMPGQPYPPQPYAAPAYPQQPATGGGWSVGDAVGNLFYPGGQPTQRIPETGILPGGGYRPELP